MPGPLGCRPLRDSHWACNVTVRPGCHWIQDGADGLVLSRLSFPVPSTHPSLLAGSLATPPFFGFGFGLGSGSLRCASRLTETPAHRMHPLVPFLFPLFSVPPIPSPSTPAALTSTGISLSFSLAPSLPRQKEDQPFGPASGSNSVRREWTQRWG